MDITAEYSRRLKLGLAAACVALLFGCTGAAENAAEELAVSDPPVTEVDPSEESPQGLQPTANLSAADSLIDRGATTTLSWSSSDASGCAASGAWSGDKNTSGSELVGPLTAAATFTLTCSGSGGNAVVMITVNVNGNMSLSWVAPTENVDGSALTDLAGYSVYFGDQSRIYLGSIDVNNANATSFNVSVPAGDYFVAMTARDGDGNESAYSNEVLKTAD